MVDGQTIGRFPVLCQSLPIGRDYRSAGRIRDPSGVTLRDLIERKGEG